MRFNRIGGAGIFDDDCAVIHHHGVAGSGFHADVGGDAANDQGIGAVLPQNVLQI